MRRVEDKVALITGAARGQGRSHAVRLAEEGAAIVAVDVCEPIDGVYGVGATEEDLEETVRLVEATGGRIVAAKVDVRDVDALGDAVGEAVDRLGRLDIVSANAGITPLHAAVHELPESRWRDTVDINLTGVWHTAKVAVPHILAGGRGGSIVITSSAAGLKAYEGIAAYVASKHGTVGLMRALAVELAPHMIRVNSIHPTQVDTPMIMNDDLFRTFFPDLPAPGRDDFAEKSREMNAMPVPWVEPIDVSNALLFLASDEARYITGATLPVDLGTLVKP